MYRNVPVTDVKEQERRTVMKDKIIARFNYYKSISEERATNNIQGLTDRVIHKERADVWEQAIAIVREITDD